MNFEKRLFEKPGLTEKKLIKPEKKTDKPDKDLEPPKPFDHGPEETVAREEGKPIEKTPDQEKPPENEIKPTETIERLSEIEPDSGYDYSPVVLDETTRVTIDKAALEGKIKLEKNYQSGFGIFPAGAPEENFYEQVWTRDCSQATLNHYAIKEPQAAKDSLETIFKHQRNDGALPFRIERQYMLLKVTPGLRSLAKPMFNLIERVIKGREERPVYEGQDFSSAEDTVPLTIMAAGEFALASPEGKKFAEENFDKLVKAINFFRTKVDSEDGLAVLKNKNADWEDSIIRGGKLGGINVLWARSLRLMGALATQLGKRQEAVAYREEFQKVKDSIMQKLYNQKEGYFMAEEGTDRLDTTASISGCLYLLNPAESVRVQESFKKRVKTPSGLKNFDPPYPPSQILWPHRVIGHQGYHNEKIWPWVTCQNIHVKIKIALDHPDASTRNQYKNEAVNDLADMAKLFNEAGGAYEIFEPKNRKPAIGRLYKPPKNLMGNLAAYEGAHRKMKELGWI